MLRQYVAIIKREINYMWRDRGLRNLLMWGTLLGLIIFSAIYSAQALRDIPTAVLDLDHSSQSRLLINSIAETENLSLQTFPADYQELEDMIVKGQVVVGVVIPENFGKDTLLHRPTRVLVIIDGSNMIYATNASTAMMTITGTLNAEAGVKTMVAKGLNVDKAKEVYQSINYQDEGWFNPTLNYAYFLVLALILNIWQQCCMLAASVNIIGERGFKSWLQIKTTGISLFNFFVGKSIAHITIFMIIILPIYLVSFAVLKLPLRCSFSSLIIFTLLFAVAVHSIGTLMSGLMNNAVDATRLGMMIALPSFVLCGYTWPVEAMPAVMQKLVWLLPQTWFFQGINLMVFKNAGWSYMSSYYLALVVIAVFCYGAAALILTWRERP